MGILDEEKRSDKRKKKKVEKRAGVGWKRQKSEKLQ